ncbi:MAG: histidine kinase [Candidatus Dormiibacterota bacterium]
MLAPGELTSMTDLSTASDGESRRVVEARERAEQRVRRQRDTLRPLGLAVILVVVASAIAERPSPALQGRGLGVTLALVAFAGALAQAIRPGFTARQRWFQAAVISLMGGAGAALVALQPQGATDLAGGAAVWMALVRLPLKSGVAIGVAVAVASVSAAALAGSAPAALLAAGLLLAMLGFVGYFMRQSRANQDRVELLLAQLEDARDEQTRAAAIAERSRIAGELHDVLAHSLSAAAIQLQAARKLAERDRATPSTRAAIDRAGDLVKDGLVNARQAVGALRGEELPGVAQIESLITSFRNDLNADVKLSVEGAARTIPPDAGLALYRGVQEALTNVARYAPGATIDILLRYDTGSTCLVVEDCVASASDLRAGEGLRDVGGGRGLAGLRERLERVGGTVQAGPIEHGWRVEVVVPA